MRVLFDHQVFDSQTVEGPSRYFIELARHLMGQGVDVEFAVRETDNVYLHENPRWSENIVYRQKESTLLTRLRQLGVRLGVVPFMATIRANQEVSENALKSENFDIFHPTYYEPYFLSLLRDKPFVITVHDMIHELFPQYAKPGNPTTAWKKTVIAKAAHIIAVSECTKHDLIKLADVPPNKVTVVHHGVGRPFTAPHPSRLPTKIEGSKYLLYLGSRDRYKNFTCLLQAMTKILQQNPELNLVCVGGGVFGAAEKQEMNNNGVRQHVQHTSASDDELASLYRGAEAFVFPSLYEGFGLPILEAMACGCPVLLSRASAFPEVGANAALYFNPRRPPDLSRVINQLLASSALQKRLRYASRQRAKQFTWPKAARKTLSIYEQILTAR